MVRVMITDLPASDWQRSVGAVRMLAAAQPQQARSLAERRSGGTKRCDGLFLQEKSRREPSEARDDVELMIRFELTTSSLPMTCSTY